LLEEAGVDFVYIHTGQHYDYEMNQVFIEELGLPKPHYMFKLEHSSPAAQIGEVMIHVDRAVSGLKSMPRLTLVQGGTRTASSGRRWRLYGIKYFRQIRRSSVGSAEPA